MKAYDIKGKPIYIYHGKKDSIYPFENTTETTLEFFKRSSAKIETNFVSDFDYVFPNALPAQDPYNPEGSCDATNFRQGEPIKGANAKCGYDLAAEIFKKGGVSNRYKWYPPA